MLNFQLTNIKLSAHLKEFYKAFNITAQQFNVIRLIRESENAVVSNAYLKERLVEKDADISRLIIRLSEQGLIEKNLNPVDKRQSEIRLTEKGNQIYDQIIQDLHYADRFFYRLSKKDLKTLNSLLNKIRRN